MNEPRIWACDISASGCFLFSYFLDVNYYWMGYFLQSVQVEGGNVGNSIFLADLAPKSASKT